MPNLALYRKYRPQNFDEVSGQETITRILKNQIATNRIGHAYLFSGIRGTGKTTIAKIFAKAVNCENPVDGSPCGKCETCLALNKSSNVDIIEIDAASNRGVDEIRNLKETINYLPSFGKYKVYIIDEVHMLTKEAFNALLKTLEEPPEHAIFILATTEPAKLPQTILSRCQIYGVRPIDYPVITKRLKEVVEREGIEIEDEALTEVSKRSGHSMRDALSTLDQCIDLRLPGEIISKEDVTDFLGISPRQQIEEIIRCIAGNNTEGLLNILSSIRESGIEESRLLEDLSADFKELLYFKLTAKTDTGNEDFYLEMAPQFENYRIYEIIDKLIEAHSKLRYNQLAQVLTDTTLLALTTDSEKPNLNQVNSNHPGLQNTPLFHKSEQVPESAAPPVNFENSEPFYPDSIDFEEAHLPHEPEKSVEKPQEKRVESDKEERDKKTVKKSKPKISVKTIKERAIAAADRSGEKLISQLFEHAELKLNKHGLFILIEDGHAFMFNTLNFSEKLQSIVDSVMGERTKVYPKLKSKYYEHFKNRETKSLESRVKEVVGEDVLYVKEGE